MSVSLEASPPLRTAIVFTANTLHVAQANLMIESLFDPKKGNFKGDLWVISTHLSPRCQRFLDSRGIRYLINPLQSVQAWPYRAEIARAQPEFQRGDMNEDEAFLLYRNKRMSKLIVCDWVEKFGANYDAMALCDNDLYFQRDVSELFSKTAGTDPNVVWYWHEENANLPGTNLWIKDFHFARYHNRFGLDFGMHEINIGFVVTTPRLIAHVFDRVRQLFWDLRIELFRDNKWHDQDLVRVIRAQDPQMFRLFDEGDVLHLCNGGQTLIEEPAPQQFYHKKTQERPFVVHFAGGAWKPFVSIAASYKVEEDPYFFMEEQTERFDRIRARVDYDPFDAPTQLFSRHNVETRDRARATWMALRRTSKKPAALFFTWLDTGSHNPLGQTLADILSQDMFDLAVIDGNVKYRDHQGLIAEDLPDLIARVTQTIKNDGFGRNFGYAREDVPEEAISGAMAALIKEYGCPARNARAVVNAAYLYLSKTLAFYQPDVVLGWGAYLLCSRLLKYICKKQGIPYITTELSVLPNSLAFDVSGHMGESWVARDPSSFSKLPLMAEDYATAHAYLAEVRADRPSRNIALTTQPAQQAILDRLASTDKKVVLFIGSNDPFSGNTPYDARGQEFHSPFYEDNDAIVRHLSETFGADPEIEVVYKPHPITITRGLDLKNRYPGVTVLEGVDLGLCLEAADLAVVNVSQGAYEALLRDVPVLMVGRNQITGSGAVYELSDRNALAQKVRDAVSKGLMQKQVKAFEDHVARLIRYYLYGVTGAEHLRPQEQLISDISSLLKGKGPAYLEAERQALATYRKPPPKPSAQPTFSIIMPVYNGEDYLVDCIGSILNQSFGDFELICVNNGSTDRSQEILDYFASQDARVKPLRQEEPNQRLARNNGVAQAKGKYIQFFDCDDLIVPHAHAELKEALESTNADVLYFFFDEMYNTVKFGSPRHHEFASYLPDTDLFKMQPEYKHLFAQYPFPWAKVFRADVLRDKELYFDLDCANFDDNPQNLRTLMSCDNIYVLNRPFYKFRINDNSMTQKVNPRVFGMVDALRLMNKIYDESGRYEEFQPSFVPYKIHLVNFAWSKMPENLKPAYWAEIPRLFRPSDADFFESDAAYSKFTYLTPDKVAFVRQALAGEPVERVIPAVETFEAEEEMYSELPPPPYATEVESKLIPRLSQKIDRISPGLHRIAKKIYRVLRPYPGRQAERNGKA